MSGLPAPVTSTEEFLAAVHTELVGLRADLAASRGGETDPPDGQVELTEPETKPARRPQRRSPVNP